MEEMERKPLHWSIGLMPPVWMLVQMVIMFSFMDTLFRGDWIWRALWITETILTLVWLFWWISKKVGPKTPQQKRWQVIGSIWVVFCFAAWQIVNRFNPSPNYSAIPGTGEAHVKAVLAASTAWSTRTLLFSLTYFVVMSVGTIALVIVARRKLAALAEPTSPTSISA